MTRPTNRLDDNDLAISEVVKAVLGQIPVTADQVHQAEQSLAGRPIPLPARLQDHRAVFDGPVKAPAVVAFPSSPEVDATLSRAARDAGHLTPEVQERMRRDRQAAEERKDKEGRSKRESIGQDER